MTDGSPADDVLEHSIGVATALDRVWVRWIAPAVRRLDRR
jgi:hypothetical protein